MKTQLRFSRFVNTHEEQGKTLPAIFIWNISTGKDFNICTGHKLITSIAELGGDHDMDRHNFLYYAVFCVSRHKNAKHLKVHILFIVYICSEEHTWSKAHQHCLDNTAVKHRRIIRLLHQIRQLFSQDEEESQRHAPAGARGDIILATQSLARDLFADIGRSMHEPLGIHPSSSPQRHIQDITNIPTA